MLTHEQRSTILTMRNAGFPCSAIAIKIGKTYHSVQQFVFRHGLSHKIISTSPSGKRYNWNEIQKFYDDNNDRYRCLLKFGLTSTAWDYARKTGKIKLRSKVPRMDIFILGRRYTSAIFRHHLLKVGWLKNKCIECGITDWNGKHITFQIHHNNGNPSDNRLCNLKELCPNCHTQTANYGNKNTLKKQIHSDIKKEITKLSTEGFSALEISTKLGCSPATIAHVINGWKRWRYR